ncbi:MAG: CHASE domain-containing protein [Methylococcaceae bacterium]
MIKPWLAAWLLSAIVLIGGFGVTAGLYRHAQRMDTDGMQTAFEFSANLAANNIRSRLDAYLVAMRGLQGFFHHFDHISYDEFRDYVQMLHLHKQPGLQAVSLVLVVTDAEKQRHIAEMRQQGFSNYQIKPEGQRDSYAPITYIEPFSGDNIKALGFDILTEPTARKAVEQSRDANDIRITSRITLVQDAEKPDELSFVMYMPFYKNVAFDTLADQRAAIAGWVDVPFRMKDLMAGLRSQIDPDLDLEIFDGEQQSDQTRIYRSNATPFDAKLGADNLQTSRKLEIGGHQWTLRMSTTPAFVARISSRHEHVLIASTGSALTIMLSWLTWLLFRGWQNAQACYQQLFAQAGEGVLIMSLDHRFVDANATILNLLGYTRAELLKLHLPDILAKHEHSRVDPITTGIINGASHQEEWVHVRKDGAEFPVEVSARKLLNGKGYFAILRNLTERKKAEARIQRLTQLYQALIEINQAIVRTGNELDLFPLACMCAVDFGGIKMAWIGQLDELQAHILPKVSYGTGVEYLDGLLISSSGSVPSGQGPTATALRTNQPVIINNYLTDPMTRQWRDIAEKFGWGSAASFPIQRNGKPFSVLSVYHQQTDAFDEEAIDLLKEMAIDISFALNNFDREAQRQLAEQALAENEAKMWTILENVSAYIYLKDSKGRYMFANRPCRELWNLTMEEIIGTTDDQLFDAQMTADILESDRRVLINGETNRREETGTASKTGKKATYWAIKIPLRREDGTIYGLCGISTDITELKQAEEKLNQQLKELRQWYAVTLDREDRVAQLKAEVNELRARLGEPPHYATPNPITAPGIEGQ